MEQYPSNAINKSIVVPDEKPAEDDKGVTSVISGEATIRKPSGMRRLRRSFIGGDATTVSEHIIWNLMIPAAQGVVADMASTFVDMMIFGERRTPRGGYSGGHNAPSQGLGSTSRFSYSGLTSSPIVVGPGQQQHHAPQEPTRANPSQVVLNNRPEAELVLNKMHELIQQYSAVSVADLYRMLNKSPNYMDDKWGWTSIDGYNLKRVRDGVLLDLPDPKDIS